MTGNVWISLIGRGVLEVEVALPVYNLFQTSDVLTAKAQIHLTLTLLQRLQQMGASIPTYF